MAAAANEPACCRIAPAFSAASSFSTSRSRATVAATRSGTSAVGTLNEVASWDSSTCSRAR